MTNLAIFNRHGMSLEQIAKSMDIAFLALIDQLLEVGHFITALEMIDMNSRPLLSATSLEQGREVITRYLSLPGARVQLKHGRINSVINFMHSTLKNCKSSAVDVSLQRIFLRLHSIWSINVWWNVLYMFIGYTANFA